MNKKQLSTVIILVVMLVVFFSGCGRSSSAAEERQDRKQNGFSETDSNEKNPEEPSSDSSTEKLPKGSLVWVKDTETVNDMRSGEVITWQHECTVNRMGLIEEDLARGTDNRLKIVRYRYDKAGNCVWESTYDGTNVHGLRREYNTDNQMIIETLSSGNWFDESEWRNIDQELLSDYVDPEEEIDPEIVAGIQERIDLFIKYSLCEVYTEGERKGKVYIIPAGINQYEYDPFGKYDQLQLLYINPDDDVEVKTSYEDLSDGYKQTNSVYQYGRLRNYTVFCYDGFGRETYWELEAPNRNAVSWRRMEYDSAGNVIECFEHSNVGRINTTYEYDINGNVISEKIYDYDWSEDVPCMTCEYTYKQVAAGR